MNRNINEHFKIEDIVFCPVFEFRAECYPGAVNPEFDGCSVLVLVIRSNDGKRCYYSFHNMTEYVNEIEDQELHEFANRLADKETEA